MRFLVEDNSMAVITGAGAEYGDPREKHIFMIHSDSQTFIRCFCLYVGIFMEYYFYKQIQSFISILPSFHFSLSWCHHGEDTRDQTHQRLSPSTHADDS